ncbi:MAG: hypothetical protein ACK5BE_04600 [Alphaproteobacteria bacterium]|jgi:hypothetical protein
MITIACLDEKDEFVEVTLYDLESLTDDQLRALLPEDFVNETQGFLNSLPERVQDTPEVKELAERLSSLYGSNEEKPTE